MKKVIITASIILAGLAANAQSGSQKSNLEFQKYIAKNISYNTDVPKVETTSEEAEQEKTTSKNSTKVEDQVLAIFKNTSSRKTAKAVVKEN